VDHQLHPHRGTATNVAPEHQVYESNSKITANGPQRDCPIKGFETVARANQVNGKASSGSVSHRQQNLSTKLQMKDRNVENKCEDQSSLTSSQSGLPRSKSFLNTHAARIQALKK